MISYATLFGFLFTLVRISCVFAFLPLGAFRAAPDAAKIALALTFTLLLFPEWKAPAGAQAGIGALAAGISGEAVLGMAIGVALSVVLEAFQMAAQIVSLQAGFGFASTFDPASGADSTVLLVLAQLTAGLLFFATGSDRLLVRALADSLKLAPPDSFSIQRGWAEATIRFSAGIFVSGLRLAAPIVALLLLADAAMAVLGRIQSQIQLIGLTIPVKLAVALLLIAMTLPFQPRFFESTMSSCIRLIEGMLRGGPLGR
ncbi:MAG: flagellar biosynthetic protein FliR [Acidobacteriota bacterium]|nr:flagellar biosynthetic protein FliR [Acidobacteriota bacterium]